MNTSTSTSTFTTVISDLPKTWDQKVDERAMRAMSRHTCSKSSRGLSSTTESVQQPPWNRVPASMSPRGIDCRREHAKANAKVERLFRPAVENNLIDYYQEPTSSARPAPPPATSTHRPLRKNIADVRKQLNLLADEVRSGEVPLSMEEIAEALSVLDKDLVLCERQALNVASERPKSPTSKPKEPKEVPKAKEIDGLDERGCESFERAFTRQPATPVVQVKLSGFQRTGFERERGARMASDDLHRKNISSPVNEPFGIASLRSCPRPGPTHVLKPLPIVCGWFCWSVRSGKRSVRGSFYSQTERWRPNGTSTRPPQRPPAPPLESRPDRSPLAGAMANGR